MQVFHKFWLHEVIAYHRFLVKLIHLIEQVKESRIKTERGYISTTCLTKMYISWGIFFSTTVETEFHYVRNEITQFRM